MRRPTHLKRRQTAGRAYGEDVTLRRRAAGRWDDNGEWQPGDLTDTPIRAGTAPVRMGEQRVLEVEGVRLVGTRAFWTATRLHAAESQTTGDLLIWKDQTWRVIFVGVWDADLYEAQAVRVDDP